MKQFKVGDVLTIKQKYLDNWTLLADPFDIFDERYNGSCVITSVSEMPKWVRVSFNDDRIARWRFKPYEFNEYYTNDDVEQIIKALEWA